MEVTEATGAFGVRRARPADAEAIARVQVHTWQTTYRHIVNDDFLLGLDRSLDIRVANRRDRLRASQHDTVVAVTPGDLVVGYADAGTARGPEAHTAGRREGPGGEGPWPSSYSGELYAIYILKGWQGLGVGTALIREAARHLVAARHSSMLVWVLADNPSRVFYERMGGHPAGQTSITIGQQTLAEVAYGWDDLGRLVQEG